MSGPVSYTHLDVYKRQLLFRYIKKRKFNGDITLRYLVWYGAGRFWIEGLRTDSLMLVPLSLIHIYRPGSCCILCACGGHCTRCGGGHLRLRQGGG